MIFEKRFRNKSKKNFKKSLRDLKRGSTFATRKQGEVHLKYWFKRRENFFKKKFQKVWQIRKEVLLLHPQSEMIATE